MCCVKMLIPLSKRRLTEVVFVTAVCLSLRLFAACFLTALLSQIICLHTSPPTLSHCLSLFSERVSD